MNVESIVSLSMGVLLTFHIIMLGFVEDVSVWLGLEDNFLFIVSVVVIWCICAVIVFIIGSRWISRFFEEERQAELDEFSQREGGEV